jgi:hypothetical protein
MCGTAERRTKAIERRGRAKGLSEARRVPAKMEERGENKEGECEESVEVHLKRTLNLLGGCSDLEVLGIGRAG